MEKEKDAPRKEEKKAQTKEVQIDGSQYRFKENSSDFHVYSNIVKLIG